MSAGVVLRQVHEDDRWLMWEWRNSERIRRVSTNDVEISRDTHSVWFAQGFPTMRDSTIIVEFNGDPVGWFQIEGWDSDHRTGEWGVGLGVAPGTPGLGGALPLLALGHAFDRLDATTMTGRVLGLNDNMLAIMRRLGIQVDEIVDEPRVRADGSTTTMVRYRVLASEWPRVRDDGLALLPTALRTSLITALSEKVGE